MADVKFTPGPWATRFVGGLGRTDADEITVFVNSAREIVSIDFGYDASVDAENEANAHLIAASPDLYEALKGILEITDRKHVVWDKARAALAKAEGQS